RIDRDGIKERPTQPSRRDITRTVYRDAAVPPARTEWIGDGAPEMPAELPDAVLALAVEHVPTRFAKTAQDSRMARRWPVPARRQKPDDRGWPRIRALAHDISFCNGCAHRGRPIPSKLEYENQPLRVSQGNDLDFCIN